MRKTRPSMRGFSLVELVIVLVIIGVIAAIAIPRMSKGAKGAGESALVGNLAVLRNAVELYASEHNGIYPGASDNTAATFVEQLTKYSDESGATSDTKSADYPLGPYLRKGIPAAPVGPNKGSTDVTMHVGAGAVAVNESAGTGWVYSATTGDIIVNADDTDDSGDKTYDAY